jgi:hypothetical protein
LITPAASASAGTRSTNSPLNSSIPSLPIPVDADRENVNRWQPGRQEPFKVINQVNALLAHQSDASGAKSAYARLDALAVEQLTKVRDTPRKWRFLGSLALCMALATVAWIFELGPLLLLLPVVVFALLQRNERVRRASPWQWAVYARTFAEYLRLREAVKELGLSPLNMGQCFPRRDSERFLPVVLGVVGLDAVEALQPHAGGCSTNAFEQWVASQVSFYAKKGGSHSEIALFGKRGFEWAFSGLAVIATLVILLSIAWPFLFPGDDRHFLRPLAASIGSALSAFGLIAINYARDLGAGPTAADYRHMHGVFESVEKRLNAGQPIESSTVTALIEEVLSEHASWFARTVAN